MNTITGRIRFYFLAVVVTMGLIMILGIGIVLPNYYTNYQLGIIEDKIDGLRELREEGKEEEVYEELLSLQNQIGGELYVLDDTGIMRGYGKGRMSNHSSNLSSFVPSGDEESTRYVNKLGIEIYAYAILLDGEYLIYEVDIESLDDAIRVINRFLLLIITIGLILAFMLSVVLTRQITKPIQLLNQLAQKMKKKEAEAAFVVKNHDELYELNGAINGMYEELKANIYQLESELSKERNTELLKKRFLAQATHELKTPIAVIGGYAELLVEGMYQSEEEEAHYHQSIYDESKRMNRLIMDVLDYTKMETGQFRIQKKEQDIHQWAKVLEHKWLDLASQANKSLTIQIPKESLLKEFDDFRMEQVMTNLLTNAFEHATSKVNIRIQFYDSKVVIQVSNDGRSIAEEDLPYLFDSFYKAKGKKSGTGLGLAIVKAIMGLHQGEYRVENHLDGVTFSVSF